LKYYSIHLNCFHYAVIVNPVNSKPFLEALTTITFSFINTNASLSLVTNIGFQTGTDISPGTGELSPSDQFTISVPPYGPAGTYSSIPSLQELEDTNTYNLLSSSSITLTTANPISVIDIALY
jgi:hypothetical protein